MGMHQLSRYTSLVTKAKIPDQGTRLRYQAEVTGRAICLGSHVWVPDQDTMPEYKAKVPGHGTRPRYETSVPGQSTRSWYQASVLDQSIREGHQTKVLDQGTRPKHEAILSGHSTRPKYHAVKQGQDTKPRYRARVPGRRQNEAATDTVRRNLTWCRRVMRKARRGKKDFRLVFFSEHQAISILVREANVFGIGS